MLKKLTLAAAATLALSGLSACAAASSPFMPSSRATTDHAAVQYTAPRFRGVPFFVYTPEVGTFVGFDAVQPTFFIKNVYLVREHGQWLASHSLGPQGPWVLVKPALLSSALRHVEWAKVQRLAFERRTDKKYHHFVILTREQYQQILARRH